MSHYAQIENGTVTQVIVAHSKAWCVDALGGEWVQTSYNTHAGEHTLGGSGGGGAGGYYDVSSVNGTANTGGGSGGLGNGVGDGYGGSGIVIVRYAV